jgi:hypothetical protein
VQLPLFLKRKNEKSENNVSVDEQVPINPTIEVIQ